MNNEDQILTELKNINLQLQRQNKNVFNNFLIGFLQSIGYFLGTLVVFIIVGFYLSKFDWATTLSKSIESTMSRINWSKIVPNPQNIPPTN